MVDIFEKPELRLARVSLPEFRFPSFASGARGPFRYAQEDYLKILMIRATLFAL